MLRELQRTLVCPPWRRTECESLSLSLFLAVLSTWSADAHACPGGYDAYTCDGGGAAAVCQTSGTTYECDLTRNGDSNPADVLAIYDPAVCYSGDDYCVWGEDSTGASFCCSVTDGNLERLTILGGADPDRIRLFYGGSNLANHGGVAVFTGQVLGRAGADDIEGSKDANADYKDKLHGDAGADTIQGHAGDDELTGDSEGDFLYGGDGNDEIRGGNQSDTIQGDIGNDTVYAGDGNDLVSGGDGTDSLHGDGHDDTICGDIGTDVLTGGGGDDLLWGPDATDSRNGGTAITSDLCDPNGANTACVTSLTVRPACGGP